MPTTQPVRAGAEASVLKNTIDWVSQPVPNEPPLAAFAAKMASLMNASLGALGGLRGSRAHSRHFGNSGVVVLPQQVAVSRRDAFAATPLTIKDASRTPGSRRPSSTSAKDSPRS